MPPCFLLRAAPASSLFFWILACLLPQRGKKKKKRSRMFGKICRSVEHFLHWCKRRGGQRGRGGSRSLELRVRAPGRGPRALQEGLLSILDPFSGPATFASEETVIVPPQQAPRSSELAGVSLIPARSSSGKRSGRRAGPPHEDGVLGAAVARWPPNALDRGLAGRRGGRFPAAPTDNLNGTSTGLSFGQFPSKHTLSPPRTLGRTMPRVPGGSPAVAALGRAGVSAAQGSWRVGGGSKGSSARRERRVRVPGWVAARVRRAARRDPAGGGRGSAGKEEEEEDREEAGGGRGRRKRRRRRQRRRRRLLSPPALRAEEFAARAAGLPQEPRDARRRRSSETRSRGGGVSSESSASRRRPGGARRARSPPRLPAAAGGASPGPSPRPAPRGRPGPLRDTIQILLWDY
ncbi:serine/arginine repetitive matrix protein 3-like [Cervus canadensis]|uniref:serine/arginine repetitive matrix protein 3-like n=1 Tax=Cervus canadensis TaxID=1574408 RepID=UPI001C9E52A2|nr:serine/arginine repetitive matrix protein 3-like [Cervus canadensis]